MHTQTHTDQNKKDMLSAVCNDTKDILPVIQLPEIVAILLCLDSKQKTKCDSNAAPDVVLERAVPRLRCPTLQYFRKHFLVPGRPVILEGVADHWPCMKKWR